MACGLWLPTACVCEWQQGWHRPMQQGGGAGQRQIISGGPTRAVKRGRSKLPHSHRQPAGRYPTLALLRVRRRCMSLSTSLLSQHSTGRQSGTARVSVCETAAAACAEFQPQPIPVHNVLPSWALVCACFLRAYSRLLLPHHVFGWLIRIVVDS